MSNRQPSSFRKLYLSSIYYFPIILFILIYLLSNPLWIMSECQDWMLYCYLIYAIYKFKHLFCTFLSNGVYSQDFPFMKSSLCLPGSSWSCSPFLVEPLGPHLHLQAPYILSNFSCPHTRGLSDFFRSKLIGQASWSPASCWSCLLPSSWF